jgi:arginyl-tRNA synthetase
VSTVADLLTELVGAAAAAAGHEDSPVPLEPCVATQDPRHGDYQSNFAFRLGKALRTNPRQVATDIAAKVPAHPAVAGVEVAGPGFLNFRLSDDWLGAEIARRAADARFDGPTPGAGKTLVIDYSSPNIAKRMHVGHLRSTIIGNALDRMYRYLGYEVVADNHIGDWGTQFGKLIYAWNHWRDDAAYAEDAIGELQRLYQKFGVVAKDQPELIEEARAETAKLQEGDPTNRALWETFVDVSMKEFDAAYDRMGIAFDVVHGESFYREGLGALVDGMLESGLAVVSEGAVVVPFTGEDGKGLAKSPLLIRKRDGASLYGTTDLATIEHRVATWDPSTIVYVTDVRQKLHFRQVFAAARKMGHDRDYRHVWFGILRFGDGQIASTRGGGLINLVDLLDEAAANALRVVNEASPHLPEDERQAIAEAVGIGAVKYADLSQNPQSDIIFEWSKVLSMQGNTAVYLMYAHARCRSLMRKAGIDLDYTSSLSLSHLTERELAVQLLRFTEVVTPAAEGGRPNLLADALYQTASKLASFWHDCPVLRDDVADDVRASRLMLVVATARVLSVGMTLLGIEPLERM